MSTDGVIIDVEYSVLTKNQEELEVLNAQSNHIRTLIQNASYASGAELPKEFVNLLSIPQRILDKSFNNINDLKDIVTNAMLSRQQFFNQYLDNRRDIDDECGYKKTLSKYDARLLYDTDPIAHRTVQVLPQESWMIHPEVTEDDDPNKETAFEKAFEQLGKSLKGKSWHEDKEQNALWEYLLRLDILSGVGQFGVLLFGLDDGKTLDQPALEFDENGVARREKDYKLLFLRVFDESLVQVQRYCTDPLSPRFGMPEMYNVVLFDPKDSTSQSGVSLPMIINRVHWTRMIHVADNLGSSEIFGYSRLKIPYRRIYDMMKLYSGSAEMYWKGAFPGIAFETNPQFGGNVEFSTDLKDQMENYMNGLQRYLALTGITAKTLTPTVVDPTPQINSQLQALCIQIGVPLRVFQGSERGQLASTQDDSTWNDRLARRQNKYITPRIICPVIDRLIEYGVLPEPKKYKVKWPDLNALTDAQKAQIAVQRIQAITSYITGGGNQLVQEMDFLTFVMGISQTEAKSILENTFQAQQEQAELQAQQIREATDAGLDIDPETGEPKEPTPPQLNPEMTDDGSGNAGQPGNPTAQPPTRNTVSEALAKLIDTQQGRGDQAPNFLQENNRSNDVVNRAVALLSLNTPAIEIEEIEEEFEEVPVENDLVDDILTENDFKGHAGRPGKRGGSKPKNGGTTAVAGLFPKELGAKLNILGSAGGTTGAKFAEYRGNKFVLKKGTSSDHLLSEHMADSAYKAAGIAVPNYKVYGTPLGLRKLSHVVEGKKLSDVTGSLKVKAIKDLRKGFAVDVALGNWDVTGKGHDNVIVTKQGKAYRIDNGGALQYRAQGKLKGDKWNGQATEWHSLRDRATNPDSAKVFGGMTHAELKASVTHLNKHKDDILKVLSPGDAHIVSQRIAAINEHLKAETAKPTKARPKKKQEDVEVHNPDTGKYLHATFKEIIKEAGLKGITAHDLKMIEKLNPKGIQEHLFVHDKMSKQGIESLKAMLDSGIQIKPKSIPGSTPTKAKKTKAEEVEVVNPNTGKHLAKALKEAAGHDELPGVNSTLLTHIAKLNPHGIQNDQLRVPSGTSPQAVHSLSQLIDKDIKILHSDKVHLPKVEETKAGGVLKYSNSNLKKAGKQAMLEWAKSMTDEQSNAVKTWKGSSGTIRKAFGKAAIGEELTPLAQNFHKAITTAPIHQGMVYRGLKDSEWTNEQVAAIKATGVGGKWSDPSPGSASRHVEVGKNFSNQKLLLVVKTKTGRNIEIIPPYVTEAEVVLMPKVEYRIKSIHDEVKISGHGFVKHLVELEEI